ncbi:hypothetical protein TH61_02865 [Rufibacter sp. DG15C]|nr:hypothetical protein TH61_02865 [Rufibacter sp. DG15C]
MIVLTAGVNTPLRSPQGENLRIVEAFPTRTQASLSDERLSRLPALARKRSLYKQEAEKARASAMQKRQAGTARGGKTGPRGRERLAVEMK